MADTTPAPGDTTAADQKKAAAEAKRVEAEAAKLRRAAEKALNESLLVRELREQGHGELADKVHATDILHTSLAVVDVGEGGEAGPVEMRPLTDDEADLQRELALSLVETDKVAVVEYGTFVARSAIDEGNARAYNRGDPVPISNVEKNDYEVRGLVRRVVKED